MSIRVANLSKKYGSLTAVSNLNFEAQKGEIVAFLGPNGAGKSTVMKILTGYLTPSEGDAWLCDLSIKTSIRDVQRCIGYLPEHNPLYPDMYVREYLDMVASLYGMTKRKDAVSQMIEQVGLQQECKKKIAALSKGYKQRVGLAQALIHNPQVLILDEPTTGLDPNQLIEIRQLIAKLGKEKTVLLSTHIMQEVEAIADRIIILNKGQKVADAPIAELISNPNESMEDIFHRLTDSQPQ